MSGFQIKTYTIKTKKLKKGCKVTFALLADLHNKEYGPENQQLIQAVKELKPDAILVAGDMLIGHTRHSFLPAQKLVWALQREAAPVYYGNGNHESRMRTETAIYKDLYERYMGPLRQAGVTELVNESSKMSVAGGRIQIHGFELSQSYYGKFRQLPLTEADVARTLGEPKEDAYHILLAHNPVYFDAYAAWGADLTVSGHLHGGIIRLPFLGGVITPQARLFPKYDRGLFWKGEKAMVVSPGLGTHTINVRIFNPAQLIELKLEGEA